MCAIAAGLFAFVFLFAVRLPSVHSGPAALLGIGAATDLAAAAPADRLYCLLARCFRALFAAWASSPTLPLTQFSALAAGCAVFLLCRILVFGLGCGPGATFAGGALCTLSAGFAAAGATIGPEALALALMLLAVHEAAVRSGRRDDGTGPSAVRAALFALPAVVIAPEAVTLVPLIMLFSPSGRAWLVLDAVVIVLAAVTDFGFSAPGAGGAAVALSWGEMIRERAGYLASGWSWGLILPAAGLLAAWRLRPPAALCPAAVLVLSFALPIGAADPGAISAFQAVPLALLSALALSRWGSAAASRPGPAVVRVAVRLISATVAAGCAVLVGESGLKSLRAARVAAHVEMSSLLTLEAESPAGGIMIIRPDSAPRLAFQTGRGWPSGDILTRPGEAAGRIPRPPLAVHASMLNAMRDDPAAGSLDVRLRESRDRTEGGSGQMFLWGYVPPGDGWSEPADSARAEVSANAERIVAPPAATPESTSERTSGKTRVKDQAGAVAPEPAGTKPATPIPAVPRRDPGKPDAGSPASSAAVKDPVPPPASAEAAKTHDTPPARPGAIHYPMSDDAGRVKVTWPSARGATEYELRRSADRGRNWSLVHRGPDTEHEDRVRPGLYRYRVRAWNERGASVWREGERYCIAEE